MELKDIKAVYFVGAGGIGMSAIARYFLKKGMIVGGYDKTPSALTLQLEKEGALIHYEEDVNLIPKACQNSSNTLVICLPVHIRDFAWQGPTERQPLPRCVRISCTKAASTAMLSSGESPRTTEPTISFQRRVTSWLSKPMNSTVPSTGSARG